MKKAKLPNPTLKKALGACNIPSQTLREGKRFCFVKKAACVRLRGVCVCSLSSDNLRNNSASLPLPASLTLTARNGVCSPLRHRSLTPVLSVPHARISTPAFSFPCFLLSPVSSHELEARISSQDLHLVPGFAVGGLRAPVLCFSAGGNAGVSVSNYLSVEC